MLYLSGYDHLEALEAFRNGWIQVQDLSSSLVGMAAAPKEGSQVLDVCGAPGGKSLHIADLLKGSGHVTVRDLSDYKVQMIEDNIDRSGFSNISAEVWDALELDEELVEAMDLVVADLPCSGLGILGKKPDIKNRVKPEDLDSLAELQREILSVVWQYVKPGGMLVYSTCTIDKKENEENVAWFQEHFPFEPVNIEGRLGEKLKDGDHEAGIFPDFTGGISMRWIFPFSNEKKVMERIDIKSLNLEELTAQLKELGLPAFRAKQIYQWVHEKLVASFDDMTNLSKGLRDQLKERYELITLQIVDVGFPRSMKQKISVWASGRTYY